MLCRNIIEKIEATYPRHAALDWDNVGLMVGRSEKNVEKIYIALDATEEVIEEAVSFGADMLITHHPLLFSPVKKITDEDFIGKRVVKLLQNDISYYAMHTNYDVLGMAEMAGTMLDLTDAEVLEITDETAGQPVGIGRVGNLAQAMSIEACCEFVKERYHLPNVKLFGDKDAVVKRIAISPGSGKHMSAIAIRKGAQVLVTGDIDHHEGIDAVAQGLAVIDAGHYGLEYVFMDDIAGFLLSELEGVQVQTAKVAQPFTVL